MGMGYALAKSRPDFEKIFLEVVREADAVLGFPLSEILRDGPADRLKQTEITQPAIVTVSTAVSRWIKSKGIDARVALGHSVGEYAALVHAEAMTFREALKVVHARGKLMESAVPTGQGGMAALVGANLEQAQNLCQAVQVETGKVLEVSLQNAPGQIVVSGHATAIDAASAKARDFGVRKAVKLEVSGPFHCSLLQTAADGLKPFLSEVNWTTPRIPVISNTTARPETTRDELIQNLSEQVTKTVLWEPSIRFVHEEMPVEMFVEIGSGSVLSGIVSKITPDVPCVPMDSAMGIETLLSAAA